MVVNNNDLILLPVPVPLNLNEEMGAAEAQVIIQVSCLSRKTCSLLDGQVFPPCSLDPMPQIGLK